MTMTGLKIELRLLGALLATALGGNMFIDGLRVLSDQTVTSKVAHLTTNPDMLAAYWLILAILVVPYFLTQVFESLEHHRTKATRLACWAVMAGGVLYAYMGYLSRNLDYKYMTGIFIATTLANMGMAAALAYSLNAAQLLAEDTAA